MLEAQAVTRAFGGLTAVDGVSLSVAPGRILGLIGPNGAGKSTLINLLAGSLALTRGRVLLEGEDISRWSPQRIARAGVVRTYQRCRIFRDMTVAQNVEIAALQRASGATALLRPRHGVRAAVAELLARFGLDGVAAQRAGNLPFGLQRTVEIARALAVRPRFLLLDEPFSGMESDEMARIGQLVTGLVRDGMGVVLIEHHTDVVFDLCDRILVLNSGRPIAEGTPEEIVASDEVRAAYLGYGDAAPG